MSITIKQVLKEVLEEFIKRGVYICDIVSDIEYHNSVETNISNYISDSLLPHSFYDTWLRVNHKEFYNNYAKQKGYPYGNCKEGRIQWIKYMINNHKELGLRITRRKQ